MAWIEPISTAITAAELGVKLVEASGFLKAFSNKIVFRLTQGAVIIPVFGCGGAGKSTASRIIGGTDPLDIGGAYEESWRIEPTKLVGDIPGKVLAAPGQVERVERYWPELYQKALTGRNVVILNVVAYGHHSLSIQKYQDSDLYVAGMSASDFLDAYLHARRDLEERMLEKVVNGLSASTASTRMITLVNKQDLWWRDRAVVRQHYEQGNYLTLVNRIRDKVGAARFQHEFLPVSLTLANLTTADGTVIKETSAGYGMPNHIAGLQNMLQQLEGLVG